MRKDASQRKVLGSSDALQWQVFGSSDGHEADSNMAGDFLRFAYAECGNSSPLYAQLAKAVAEDPELLNVAAVGRRPFPNMFLAAVHYLLLKGVSHPLARFFPNLSSDGIVDADPLPDLRDFCRVERGRLENVLRTRRLQTNEVGRSALLLPALAVVSHREQGRPLTLLELGASAGLNLLFDRYSYDYGRGRIRSGGTSDPLVIHCVLNGGVELPDLQSFPSVGHRLGVDLHPVDLSDEEERLWLRALVWPEHEDRAEILRDAMHLAMGFQPTLLRGDALECLPSLLADLPDDEHVLVFHSFVTSHLLEVDQGRWETAFNEAGSRRNFDRLSIEGLGSTASDCARIELTSYRAGVGRTELLGLTAGHARWLRWLHMES